MPPRGAGCQTCKNRHIKCDQRQPKCQQCVKSRRICLAASPAKRDALSIHHENAYASGKTKRPRGPRARSDLTLFRPSLDIPSRAVTYYLNYYLQELSDMPTVSACMSECLTAWAISKRKSSMVDLAISALALAIFSRTQQHPPAAEEAVSRYGRLLRVARTKITQPELIRCNRQETDEFLLTVIIMAWYETATHQPVNQKPMVLPSSLHSWSHHDGAMAILKAWNDRRGDNDPSDMIKHSRRGLLRSALLRDYSLPSWVQDGNRFGEHGLDAGFDGVMVRAVNLRHALRKQERNTHLETEVVVYLINEAQQLDHSCKIWATQLPAAWSYKSRTISKSWPRKDFYSPVVYEYAMPGYAAVWIQYFAMQMLVNSILLSLLALRQVFQAQAHENTYQQQRQDCMAQLKAMTDNLTSSIPFSLGRFKFGKAKDSESQHTLTLNLKEEISPALALPTIWPLSTAYALDHVEESQKLWFGAWLARLGRILGDGALQCAGTVEWTHG